MNSNRPGVLILSHCGFSFLEDLKEELRRRQLRCFVLSSLPLPEHVPARLEQIQTWAGSQTWVSAGLYSLHTPTKSAMLFS